VQVKPLAGCLRSAAQMTRTHERGCIYSLLVLIGMYCDNRVRPSVSPSVFLFVTRKPHVPVVFFCMLMVAAQSGVAVLQMTSCFLHIELYV